MAILDGALSISFCELRAREFPATVAKLSSENESCTSLTGVVSSRCTLIGGRVGTPLRFVLTSWSQQS